MLVIEQIATNTTRSTHYVRFCEAIHLLQIIDLLCAYHTRAFLHYNSWREYSRENREKGLMLPHSKLHLLYNYGLLLHQRGPTITFIERDSKQNISLICNKSFCSQLSQSESVRPSDSSTVIPPLHVGWFPIDRLTLPLFLR